LRKLGGVCPPLRFHPIQKKEKKGGRGGRGHKATLSTGGKKNGPTQHPLPFYKGKRKKKGKRGGRRGREKKCFL